MPVLQRVSAGSGAGARARPRCTWRWAHMEKDREPAVDAIATWFSTMLDNMGALTLRCSQIAGLGLRRSQVEGRKAVLPSASRALSQPRSDRWLQPPQSHVLPHLTTSELCSICQSKAYEVSLAGVAGNHLFYCVVPHHLCRLHPPASLP